LKRAKPDYLVAGGLGVIAHQFRDRAT